MSFEDEMLVEKSAVLPDTVKFDNIFSNDLEEEQEYDLCFEAEEDEAILAMVAQDELFTEAGFERKYVSLSEEGEEDEDDIDDDVHSSDVEDDDKDDDDDDDKDDKEDEDENLLDNEEPTEEPAPAVKVDIDADNVNINADTPQESANLLEGDDCEGCGNCDACAADPTQDAPTSNPGIAKTTDPAMEDTSKKSGPEDEIKTGDETDAMNTVEDLNVSTLESTFENLLEEDDVKPAKREDGIIQTDAPSDDTSEYSALEKDPKFPKEDAEDNFIDIKESNLLEEVDEDPNEKAEQEEGEASLDIAKAQSLTGNLDGVESMWNDQPTFDDPDIAKCQKEYSDGSTPTLMEENLLDIDEADAADNFDGIEEKDNENKFNDDLKDPLSKDPENVMNKSAEDPSKEELKVKSLKDNENDFEDNHNVPDSDPEKIMNNSPVDPTKKELNVSDTEDTENEFHDDVKDQFDKDMANTINRSPEDSTKEDKTGGVQEANLLEEEEVEAEGDPGDESDSAAAAEDTSSSNSSNDEGCCKEQVEENLLDIDENEQEVKIDHVDTINITQSTCAEVPPTTEPAATAPDEVPAGPTDDDPVQQDDGNENLLDEPEEEAPEVNVAPAVEDDEVPSETEEEPENESVYDAFQDKSNLAKTNTYDEVPYDEIPAATDTPNLLEADGGVATDFTDIEKEEPQESKASTYEVTPDQVAVPAEDKDQDGLKAEVNGPIENGDDEKVVKEDYMQDVANLSLDNVFYDTINTGLDHAPENLLDDDELEVDDVAAEESK